MTVSEGTGRGVLAQVLGTMTGVGLVIGSVLAALGIAGLLERFVPGSVPQGREEIRFLVLPTMGLVTACGIWWGRRCPRSLWEMVGSLYIVEFVVAYLVCYFTGLKFDLVSDDFIDRGFSLATSSRDFPGCSG